MGLSRNVESMGPSCNGTPVFQILNCPFASNCFSSCFVRCGHSNSGFGIPALQISSQCSSVTCKDMFQKWSEVKNEPGSVEGYIAFLSLSSICNGMPLFKLFNPSFLPHQIASAHVVVNVDIAFNSGFWVYRMWHSGLTNFNPMLFRN